MSPRPSSSNLILTAGILLTIAVTALGRGGWDPWARAALCSGAVGLSAWAWRAPEQWARLRHGIAAWPGRWWLAGLGGALYGSWRFAASAPAARAEVSTLVSCVLLAFLAAGLDEAGRRRLCRGLFLLGGMAACAVLVEWTAGVMGELGPGPHGPGTAPERILRLPVWLTFGNPNILATFLVLTLPLGWGDRDGSGTDRADRVLAGGMLAGILATQSVSGLTAAAVAWGHRRRCGLRGWLVAAGMLGLAMWAFAEPASLLNRLSWWGSAVRMMLAHPFAGVGPGGFDGAHLGFSPSGVLHSRFAHSVPLQLAAELGVVGAICWSGWMLTAASRTEDRVVKSALLGGLAMSLVDYGVLLPVNAAVLWVLTGLAVRRGEAAGGRTHREGGFSSWDRGMYAAWVVAVLVGAMVAVWRR